MSLLEVDDLCIRYGDTVVVDSLRLRVEPGESIGLVGESGSGKTQTALAILGLLPSNAIVDGSIRVGGTEVVGATDATLNQLRATKVAMVFQDPTQALNPYLRIGDQLRRILIEHGIADGNEADERVIEMLQKVGLPDPRRQSGAYPHQLSGGMRQRAMIASALISDPDLLIADEPTTALDVTVQAQILNLLDRIRRDTALLLITHDLAVVASHCQRVEVLEGGRAVETGTTQQIFAAPEHPHTKALLAAAARLEREPPNLDDGETLLEIRNTSVSYREPGFGRLRAVKSVDLDVKSGETVAIVGESGSGKSSLANAIMGLVPADAGSVSFLGETLESDVRAQAVRRNLQLVFQDPVGSLNPQMRVEDIVMEPLEVHERELDRAARLERVAGVLEQVGLDSGYLQRYPHELSGGQAQRVAIGRALVLRPRMIICDEAVAALDGSVREQVLELLGNAQQQTGLAIVFISHDLGVVRAISHRILVMYLGQLVEFADNAALFARPRHPYTRALIDAVPVPDPTAAKKTALLAGEVPSILTPPDGCAFHPRCAHADERCRKESPQVRELDGGRVACHRAEEIDL